MRDKHFRSRTDKRREHNQDLLRRMRSGESLRTVDSRSSWFPPRPIIQKDQEAISRLYNLNEAVPHQGPDQHLDPSEEPKLRIGRRGPFDQAG
jgi:hypothetical protein